MRKWFIRILAFSLALACICAVPFSMRALPMEQKDFLTRGGPDWEGIVTVSVVRSFDQGGFLAWLSARAREFEKEHEGVLLSVREINPGTYRALKESRSLSDAVILGPFVEERPSQAFVPISGGGTLLRSAAVQSARAGGEQYGVPLALGAYCLLANRALLDGMQIGPETTCAQMAEIFSQQGREIGCPAPGFLRSDVAFASMAPELSGFARYGVRAKMWPEFALDKRTVMYLGTQREVQRMRVLQSAGRGFDIQPLTPGESCYTDQLLCLCAVDPSYTGHTGDSGYRLRTLGRFAAWLLSGESQQKLADTGLFSALEGMRLYGDDPMAQLERSLEKPLKIPALFDAAANEGA